MRTNQVMTAEFFGHPIRVETIGAKVCLTDIFRVGNVLRVNSGRSAANMSDYLESTNTKEYIQAAAATWGIDPAEMHRVEGAGSSRRTMAHISLAIHAAMYLDAKFQAAVIKEFVENRLMQYRTDSGDEFIALNTALATLPDRADKDNTGMFIQLAKAMKVKTGVENWNLATAAQLRHRLEIEKFIHQGINVGFIRGYEDAKKAIEAYNIPVVN